MKWYADTRARRRRQQAADLAVLLVSALVLRLGLLVYDTVQRLRVAGTQLEQAGGGLGRGLSDAARRVDGLPLVGGPLRAPLDAAARASRTVAAAGASEQAGVHRLALVLGLLVGLLPVCYLLLRWLPGRLGYARDAGAAIRLSGVTELLALRAAASAPLHVLARLGPDPVGSWRRGEPGAAQALADLELRRLGVRTHR